MDVKGLRNLSFPFLGGLIVVGLLLGVLHAAGAQISTTEPIAPHGPITRLHDPVVVSGSQFPAMLGVPLDELALYVYRAGVWEPIPFQIDEVDLTGTLVISDDGRLDTNDELVFMGADAGEQADETNWPEDPFARLSPRYTIQVTDPLTLSAEAWAYLYHSTSLPQSGASYLSWDEVAQKITAISYTTNFSQSMIGLSGLTINDGGVDVLDRQKIRGKVLFLPINEENLVSLGIITPTITLPAVGPVRAATGSGTLQVAFYGQRFGFVFSVDTSVLGEVPLTYVTSTLDLRDPMVTGLDTYYDSNTPGGVVIDGVDDPISTTPRMNWYQVNGGVSGPGGFVVTFPEVGPGGGEVKSFYKDDSGFDSADTGDGRSYGNAGIGINNPGQVISLTLAAYILPPGTAKNVGATYFAWVENPLVASAKMEILPPASRVFLPTLQRN